MLVLGLATRTAQAETYYWDTDGSIGGFGDTAGTWGTSAFWSTNSTGASDAALTTITTSDGVHFGTATLALGSTASAVGVSGTVSVNSITFGAAQSTPVTLSGGTSITLGGTTPAITVNNTSNTISSVLAGSSFTKAGNGTLTLSGANTHTGTTTIGAGTLRLQGASPLNTGRTYTINGGAVMNLNGGATFNTSVAGSSTINGTGTLRLSGGTYSRGASGGGTLTLSLGAGGLIDIQAGATVSTWYGSVVSFTGNQATLNVDGTINGNNALTINADALTGAGTINNTHTTTLNIGANNGSGTFSGTISGTSGNVTSLTKTGTGTQTLSGNNTYSGVTTISGGILAITHNNALGNTTGNTTISATGSNTDRRLTLSNNITSPENISISGTTETGAYAAVIANTSGTNTLSGTITLASPSGGIRIAANGGLLIVSGNISQTGQSRPLVLQAWSGAALTVNNAIANNNGPLSVINPGPVTLKNASTAIGATLIAENGLLKLGVNNAIKTDQNLTIGSPWNFWGSDQGTFDLAGFNQTVNALSSATNTSNIGAASTRIVTNSAASGTSTLTVGNGNGSGIFNGVIRDGANAKVALTKVGTGMLTLAANGSYSGDTIVTNGIFRITSTNCLSSLTRVYLSTGAQTGTIDLAFTGTQMIKALYINGVMQPTGTSFGANGTTITGTGFLLTEASGTVLQLY